ncbi:TonB-dependent receptor [Steroidobacter cummioxidans]|uniref:TonB-dependent receptor n=1 Tax=Steroidobacter cummioxidans TaxID=1803913 RepID=UPI000E30CD10|nr:TonB-dependent receptor [Steroidobacter cummioxidans]
MKTWNAARHGAAMLASSFLVTTFAQAQQASTQPEGGLEEVIVTAQKREQNAQDVPIAITALSAGDLAAAGTTSTVDLKSVVPSLNITTGVAGFGMPRLRGIGASGQGPGIENPVAVYIDDVYYGATFGNMQSLFDTAQVVVSKGPQGTLYGRNTTGGLIQIRTRDPEFDLAGKVQVGYGNYDTANGGFFLTGGLSDSVAMSVSAQYDNRDKGYGVNRFTGNEVMTSESWAGRVKLLWKIGEDTNLRVSVDTNGRDGADPSFRNFELNALGQNVNTLIRDAGGDPNYDIFSDVDPELRARQSGASVVFEHDFGGFSLKSVTAYRDTSLSTYFDPDGTTQARLRIFNDNFDEQFTQEIDLISADDGPFKWTIGAFYMWNSAGQDPGRTTGLTTFGGNGYSDTITDVRLKSISGFAEGTYALTDATNLTAGIRYTNDEREFEAKTVTFNGNTNVLAISPTIRDGRTFGDPSWKLSIDHRFSPELMVYASYNRGFRSGTFVPQASPVIALEPEQIDGYEIGLKSDLLDQRLRLNVSGYYYDQTNVQVQQVIAGVNSVYNADGAEIYGADADFILSVTHRFRLFGGVGWTDATYTNFTNAIISVPYPLPAGFVIPPGQTCLGTFGSPAAQLGGNCLIRGDGSGNKLQNTPELTANLGGSLEIPTGIGTFTLAANYYYNDGFVATADERVAQGSYSLIDASVTWRDVSQRMYVRLWGNNLSEEFYRTQLSATNSGDNGTPGAPRTYGVTLGMEF